MERYRALTRHGAVVGVREGGSVIFKGIPYAAPPVGTLRFSAPVEHDDWEEDLLCDQWPPDAYRIPFPPNPRSRLSDPTAHTYSEDCLYLNIWRPAVMTQEKLALRKRRKQPRRVCGRQSVQRARLYPGLPQLPHGDPGLLRLGGAGAAG